MRAEASRSGRPPNYSRDWESGRNTWGLIELETGRKTEGYGQVERLFGGSEIYSSLVVQLPATYWPQSNGWAIQLQLQPVR